MSTKVVVNFNPIKILFEHGYPQKARQFLANEIVKVSDPYTPFRDGFLKNSATIGLDGTFIMYNTPYARRLWYGEDFNFNGAPVRGSHWVERAIASNSKQILALMQKASESGFK